MKVQSYNKGAVTLNLFISFFLIVLIILVVAGFFILKEKTNKIEIMNEDEFNKAVESGGRLLESGQWAEAVAFYSDLTNKSTTAEQEGQAKLNLAIARMQDNRTLGLEMLKDVSIDESYNALTRAKATNYVLNEFTSTKNAEFARDVIFTGPVWESFLGPDKDIDDAVINGFLYSQNIYATPESSSRLALEYSKLLFDDLSQLEKDAVATDIIKLVDSGIQSIENLYSQNRVRFGDTHYSELATAYNRMGLALDALYFNNYIQDAEKVTEMFQKGIDLIIENGNQKSVEGTELFIRYHYADFLLRAELQDKEARIVRILTPSEKMTSQHNISSFFKSRIKDLSMNNVTPATYPARPDSIALLSDISTNFKNAINKIGITESEVEAARSNQ